MDSNTVSFAVTLCLLGSSMASYVFAVLTHKEKTRNLENKITKILENPMYYRDARDMHLKKIHPRPQPKNGRYVDRTSGSPFRR